MSNYWDLFAETGDIGFYLLYLKSTEKNASPDKTEATEMKNDRQHLM
ncbi:hypothetical protein SAMN02745823_01468 [Sporobacter termitidis DSM 10068]|uniref:YqzL-like protein n=1 Tax=Sporobacter termitidis DSM 10068 TaxID=1123282 RepID=A0A1M5WYJ3_9FIRM|nr:hypothetical protein SAMN02745823_01468 [Sporobacter termitidis DSM 10068]